MKKLIIPFLLLSSLALGEIKVTEIKGVIDADKIQCSRSYPQFQLNKKPLVELNGRFIKSLEKIGKVLDDEHIHDNDIWESIHTFENHKNSFNITSVVLSYYLYTGGVHGMTVLEEYNVNSKNGKVLTFDDIFKKGFKEKVKTDILQTIKNNNQASESIYFDDIEEIDLDAAIFYFDENNVIFKFGSYSLGPYSSGLPEFRFAKKDIKKYLVREFK